MPAGIMQDSSFLTRSSRDWVNIFTAYLEHAAGALLGREGHQIVCSDMDKWSGMRGQCCNDPGNINVNRKIGPVVSLVTANTDGTYYSSTNKNNTQTTYTHSALAMIYGPLFGMLVEQVNV